MSLLTLKRATQLDYKDATVCVYQLEQLFPIPYTCGYLEYLLRIDDLAIHVLCSTAVTMMRSLFL